MNQTRELLRGWVIRIRTRVLTVANESERSIMLGIILLGSALSAAVTYALTQYSSVDVLSSLVAFPEDCYVGSEMNIGHHCFSDYGMVVKAVLRSDPWVAYPLPPPNPPVRMQYPAAGMIPHLLFGLLGKFLGAPRLGLIGYLVALTISVISPAIWAARGARGLERVVVFVALGAAAVPAWAVIDRGNSTGFLVPIALVLLVGLCRRRWGLVTTMVVLAALVKPPFAVLAVALFAARRWRWGGLALAGIVVTNVAAYLAWPGGFPGTISESIHNLRDFSGSNPLLFSGRNVSFGRAVLWIPDNLKAAQTGGKIPEDFLAGPRSAIGYVVLLAVVVSVLALGRRMPPVMVGIVLLVTATLFPPQTLYYYLVCVLPVAALVARDPDGPPGDGLFDRLANLGDRRRAVGLSVSLAAALSVAQIALPGPISTVEVPGMGARTVTDTTMFLVPVLWLVACVVIIVSYARRPVSSYSGDEWPAQADDSAKPDVSTTSSTSEPARKSLPQESPAGPH
ncbi:hypothetical protein A5641_20995 [Mycobacterium sp. 1554424.7]|nr:hypothetical protein A5641_20995 [Mycobacterium sp. 1554424.7]